VAVADTLAVAGTAAVVGTAADAADPGFMPGRAPMTASAPLRSLFLAVLLLVPLARAHAADGPPGAPPPLLPGSSVEAVLARRGALQLTPEQVKQLEQVQARLAREQQAAREELSRPPDGAAPPGGSSAGPPGGARGGMAGAKTKPPPIVRGAAASPAQLLEKRLDDLDTQAFLRAVELLPEAQREQATEIASRYREQLFEQREREKGR
jgi:hypothetical protein